MSFVDAARSESNFQMSEIKYEAEASALLTRISLGSTRYLKFCQTLHC